MFGGPKLANFAKKACSIALITLFVLLVFSVAAFALKEKRVSFASDSASISKDAKFDKAKESRIVKNVFITRIGDIKKAETADTGISKNGAEIPTLDGNVIPGDRNYMVNLGAPARGTTSTGSQTSTKIEIRKPRVLCYALNGPKWASLPTSYAINPTNSQGISQQFLSSSIASSFQAWDNATSTRLFNGSVGIDYGAAFGVHDYVNSISFMNLGGPGIIGGATQWFDPVDSGVVEFDIFLNSYYLWGDAVQDSGRMDVQGIVTHELGHGLGLGDIYDSQCMGVTMYGYTNYGDTGKRTLERQDKVGLQILYGR